jgi:hypothetical protein
LQYNFKQGETLKQSIAMNMDLVQKIMDKDMKINLAMNIKTTFDVKESRGDSYVLEVNFKELKTEVKMPDIDTGTVSFDSNTTDSVSTQANLGPMFKAIIDKPFEIVMNKNGKVESIKDVDFIEAMLNTFDETVPENLRQQMTEQFGSQFTKEAFKAQIEQNTGYLPNKPVSTGDSWNVKMETMSSNFKIIIDVKSTLKSVEDNVANLDIDGIVSTPEKYEQEINGVKTIITLNGTQKGTLKINKDTGWVISSDMMMNFKGDIEVMGMKVPIYAASKITVTGE